MDLLDLFSEPVPSGVHFDIENQIFSVGLTGLMDYLLLQDRVN